MSDAPPPGPAAPVMRFRFQRDWVADPPASTRSFRSREEFVAALRDWPGFRARPSEADLAADLGFVLFDDVVDEGWERTYLVTMAGRLIGFADCVPGDLPERCASKPPSVTARIVAGGSIGTVGEPAPAIESRPEIGSPPSGPEHPTPWRWEGVEDFVVRNGPLAGKMAYTVSVGLMDASGESVLNVTNSDSIELASPHVRALIAAAPEMEALLRRYLELTAAVFQCSGPHPLDDGGTCVHCDTVALLARVPKED